MNSDIESIRILADGLNFPEGPAFDARGRLWFVELKGGDLACYHGGTVRRFPTGGTPNGLAIDHRGIVWICDAGQRSIRTFDPETETFTTVCDAVNGEPLNKPNDLAFDAVGNLLFTCPGDSRTEPTGYVCCLRPNGEVRKIREGMFFPNGLALTDGGRSLFVAETYRQRVWKGTWDAEACEWRDARPWSAPLGGAPGPDGMAVGDWGKLFVAVYGSRQVKMLELDGTVVRAWDLPGKNPTNVAFDPTGALGLVVTEAERGTLLSLPDVRFVGDALFDGKPVEPALSQPYQIFPRRGADRHLALNGEWELQDAETRAASPPAAYRYRVSVPNSVQWALHEAGELPVPYEGCNTRLYRWIDTRFWYYRRTFAAPALRPGQRAFLCFDGADYDARVWLNGRLLGAHEGMFGGPVIEVSGNLRAANELIVELHGGASADRLESYERGITTGRLVKPWYWTLKKGHTDRFTVGLWQGVRLEVVNEHHLERPFLVTRGLLRDGAASLELRVEAFAGAHSLEFRPDRPGLALNMLNYRPDHLKETVPGDWRLRVEFFEPDGGEQQTPAHREETAVRLSPGRNWLRHHFDLPQARLWWPNGLGEQALYRVRVTLLRDDEATDEIEFTTGLRTLETVASPGPQSCDRWNDWQFVVNGQPFFVKGTNWAPMDYFLHLPREQSRWMLEAARDAGIQLIRVNAYGLIETEEFYDLCDELGLMVWQDFVIGNVCQSNFPLDVWKHQILINIFRLRNRASLAVYCGGNEFNPYSPGHAAAIGVLETCVTDFDNTRIWRRVSPDQGSVHEYPAFDATWLQHQFKFFPYLAEIGVHTFPDAGTLRKLVRPEELDHPLVDVCNDAFGEAHPELTQHFAEYHVNYREVRWPLILNYASHFGDGRAPMLEDLAEASQMAAGEFYQMFSDAAQANYPVTTGLMPWVFNRPFPQVAMQLVDNLGCALAPYYALKRTYEPTHVIVQFPHLLWAVGECVPLSLKVMHAGESPVAPLRHRVSVRDAKFQERASQEGTVTLNQGPSLASHELEAFEIPTDFADTFFFVVAELFNGDVLVSRSVYHPRCLRRMEDAAFTAEYRSKPHSALRLENGPWLKDQVARTRTTLTAEVIAPESITPRRRNLRLRIRNSGPVPAFPVRIELLSPEGVLVAEDSFFFLPAGESREVSVHLKSAGDFDGEPRLKVSAWNALTVEINAIIQ